jgi:pyruvate dehydrogenase E2 component (dihydrolipoamide acetyltransferase)
MSVEVVMPKVGLTVTEGVVSAWLVDDGGPVAAGQAVCEVETDKAVHEVLADASGTLRRCVAPGEIVQVGGILARIE